MSKFAWSNTFSASYPCCLFVGFIWQIITSSSDLLLALWIRYLEQACNNVENFSSKISFRYGSPNIVPSVMLQNQFRTESFSQGQFHKCKGVNTRRNDSVQNTFPAQCDYESGWVTISFVSYYPGQLAVISWVPGIQMFGSIICSAEIGKWSIKIDIRSGYSNCAGIKRVDG